MKTNHQDIRIGTLVRGAEKPAKYIKEILKHGFESFQINFSRTIGDVDLAQTANEVKEALGDSGAVISCLGIYGNPLENDEAAAENIKSWEALIKNAHLFGTKIISGFTGRIRNKSIEESIPRFKEVFTPLVKKASDNGVKIAFENCDMGGCWETGDWNIAQTPAAWEMMFNEVSSDNIGLEWEPCHQMVKLIDPIPQLRKWVPKIFHIHGKDATIDWDVIKEYGIKGSKKFAYHRTPGFGDSNWSDIISILRMNNFQGSIDIEGWHDPVYREELEMTGQVHALNYLKTCRGGEYIQNPDI
jgi:sugar phosphate isomerase/epimerase